MNILLLSTHFNTGGITSYMLTLTRGLSKQGHRVCIVSSGGNCVEQLGEGVVHITLDIKTKSELSIKLYMALPALLRLVKERKIDIIHAQTRVTQVLGQVLSWFTGVAVVSTCHGFFRPRVFRRTFPCWGDGVVAISQGVVRHLTDDFKVNADQVALIPTGVDTEAFSVDPNRDPLEERRAKKITAQPVIGIIARLSDVKGHRYLIEAMPGLVKGFPDVLLMIIGEGPEEHSLLDQVARLNMHKHVRFEKVVNCSRDVLPLFDIFVMPSVQEGLGISVMEAQACGIPVVASRVGGLPDLIEDGRTGFLVPPQNSEALAAKLIEVLNAPERLAVVAQQARNRVRSEFSADQMVKRTVQFYEKYMRR